MDSPVLSSTRWRPSPGADPRRDQRRLSPGLSGPAVPVPEQRCQWHKRENVVSYLAKCEQVVWRQRLQRAYHRPAYAEARRAITTLHAELDERNQSAAGSLAEGLDQHAVEAEARGPRGAIASPPLSPARCHCCWLSRTTRNLSYGVMAGLMGLGVLATLGAPPEAQHTIRQTRVEGLPYAPVRDGFEWTVRLGMLGGGALILGSGLAANASVLADVVGRVGMAGVGERLLAAWQAPAGIWVQMLAVLLGFGVMVVAVWPIPAARTRPGVYLVSALGEPLGNFFARHGRRAGPILVLICLYRLSDFLLNIMNPFYLRAAPGPPARVPPPRAASPPRRSTDQRPTARAMSLSVGARRPPPIGTRPGCNTRCRASRGRA